jgi:hypothetical protein
MVARLVLVHTMVGGFVRFPVARSGPRFYPPPASGRTTELGVGILAGQNIIHEYNTGACGQADLPSEFGVNALRLVHFEKFISRLERQEGVRNR